MCFSIHMYFSSTLYYLNYIHIYSIAVYAAPCNAVSPKVHCSYIYVLQYTYVLQQRADLCDIRIMYIYSVIYFESRICATPCNAVSSRINCAYTYVVQYICIGYIRDSKTYVDIYVIQKFWIPFCIQIYCSSVLTYEKLELHTQFAPYLSTYTLLKTSRRADSWDFLFFQKYISHICIILKFWTPLRIY